MSERSGYKHYINRDLSWVKFNERILEEAEDHTNPLFERLNFVAIYQSNLQEFIRVRVGSLYDRLLLKNDETDKFSGMDTEEQLTAVLQSIEALEPRKNNVFKEVFLQLEEYGIFYRGHTYLTKYESRFMERYFDRNVLPLLSPHIIDKHHPFPFLQTDTVYIAVILRKKNGSGSDRLGIVPASEYFERILLLPSKYMKFTLIENLLLMFADKVFPNHKVVERAAVSVIRNADIDADEAFFDYDMSYRDIMEIMVKKRTKLEPIRVDMVGNDSASIKKMLIKHLGIGQDQIHYSETPTLLSFVPELKSVLTNEKYRNLFFPYYKPQRLGSIDYSTRIIPQIQKNDLLLSYPYQDFRTFLKLLDEAADDPKVLSIKITLYRVAQQSKVIDALIRAAENGKEVITVVELRARFDEENNIDWSKRLQESGVSIIYGIEKYKVHTKILLITRKSSNTINFITQIGTGNYNETTAKLYTDFSLITANEEIALNVQDVFKNLSIGSLVEYSDLLLVSPLTLKQSVLRFLDEEISIAKSGAYACCFFKLNSLSDIDIINKLIEASDAGVKISMVIRGICCLNVERSGPTRNIRIRSIVGRFLEHSRVYIFGEESRRRMYISSADFMSRNTERRVEVAVPILDKAIQSNIFKGMELALMDNAKARVQVGGGIYQRLFPKPGEEPVSSQLAQCEWAIKDASQNKTW